MQTDQVSGSGKPRFLVHVRRDERWWMVSVPQVGGLTQARRLADVVTMARELISVSLDVAPEDMEITLDIERIGDLDVQSRLEEIARERREAQELERRLGEHTRSLARDLAALDVPQRDIGAVLGVSRQRAQQLLASG